MENVTETEREEENENEDVSETVSPRIWQRLNGRKDEIEKEWTPRMKGQSDSWRNIKVKCDKIFSSTCFNWITSAFGVYCKIFFCSDSFRFLLCKIFCTSGPITNIEVPLVDCHASHNHLSTKLTYETRNHQDETGLKRHMAYTEMRYALIKYWFVTDTHCANVRGLRSFRLHFILCIS